MTGTFLKIRAAEAMKLREFITEPYQDIVKDIADIYGCRPLQASKESFYEMLAVIFNAGAIQGVRDERAKKGTEELAPLPASEQSISNQPTAEQYKKWICEMLAQITSEKSLKRIYDVASYHYRKPTNEEMADLRERACNS